MDWIAFFNDHSIDYVTRGPNVKKGNVNIACPFCGDDPSHHMGVSLEKDAWGCWRGQNHKGKAAHNLIKELLGCSFNQAKMTAEQYSVADPENIDEAVEILTRGENLNTPVVKKQEKLSFPSEFRRIKDYGSTSRFFRYLKNRGFDDVAELCSLYSLRCATTGRWQDRIIIPIYMKNKLVSWTSRAIGTTINAPRYLALSENDGGKVNVFNSLLNWDFLQRGGDLLLIVEGPFDALKLDYYALDCITFGIDAKATCTFGTSMSDEQAMMIAEVSKKFKRAILLYDNGATEAIFIAKEKLQHTKVICGFLPDTVEDPGEMTKNEVYDFVRNAQRVEKFQII